MCVVFAVAPNDPSRVVDGDTVIFTKVHERASAVFQCNASNIYGYVLANAFVNVLGKFNLSNKFITLTDNCYQAPVIHLYYCVIINSKSFCM